MGGVGYLGKSPKKKNWEASLIILVCKILVDMAQPDDVEPVADGDIVD